MSEIDQTLAERGGRYGAYDGHARITQAIKRAMQNHTNYHTQLTDDQRETLDMLAHKLGRILNGDPEYHDSWHDIVGYSKLSADEVLKRSARRALNAVADDFLPPPQTKGEQ